MINKNQVIIALDGLSIKEALKFARVIKGMVWGFKVNDLLFENVQIIRKLKKFGKIFADAKLHDIPNTVSNSVKKLSMAGADMITVHASGGVEMMRSAKKSSGRSKILAVTLLTSKKNNPIEITKLTKDIIKSGVDGIVCSGDSLPLIQRIFKSKSLLRVVPGIRPKWYKKKDDQRRITTPKKAIEFGADYLVIGRPILNAKNPLDALAKL